MLPGPSPVAALFLAAFVSTPCLAQSIKAGLWETSTKIKLEGPLMEQAMAQQKQMAAGLAEQRKLMEEAMARMQKQLADLPPEQRKVMEDMLAKQRMNMGALSGDPGTSMSGHTSVTKWCLSKEMAAQRQLPIQQQGICTYTYSALDGNRKKTSFTCTEPATSGESIVSFSGDSAYSATTHARIQVTSSATGTPEIMSAETTGKWLGPDCGDIKPFQMPQLKR
jgi:hypothetical protein